MMRCEDALERLWGFLDGELPMGDEEEVRRHLEICSRCYPQYDFQRAYFRLMRRIRERRATPPGLRRKLFERILEEEAAGGNGSGP